MRVGLRSALYRVARGVATLLLLAVCAWLCLELAPGSPAEAAARASGTLPVDSAALSPALRQRIVAEAARRYRLDRPAPARLASVTLGLVRLDLGRSWRDGRPVTWHLRRAMPVTVGLVAAALTVAFVLGLAGAVTAAFRPQGLTDHLLTAIAAAAVAVPPAWAAILALRGLAGGHPFAALPPGGGGPPSAYVLPVGCLAYAATALVVRHGRAGLLDTAAQPFVTAARARGAGRWRALLGSALPAAAAPLAVLAAAIVPYLLGTSLVVERAFDLRGLGALLLDASAQGDAPVVLGAVVTTGALVAAATMAGDALAGLLDPRLRSRRPW